MELVLVLAEPGPPNNGSYEYGEQTTPEELMDAVYKKVYECFASGHDPVHKNVRKILDMCFLGLSLHEQLRYV